MDAAGTAVLFDFHGHASFPIIGTVVPALSRSTIEPGGLRRYDRYTDVADCSVTDIT